MDSYKQFHPEKKTSEYTRCTIYDGLSRADEFALRETMNSMTFAEFMHKGTTGTFGGTSWQNAYLIPDKLHDTLIGYSKDADIVPLIGQVVNGWEGGDLKVDIVNDIKYFPHEWMSGGQLQTETVETTQATITPKQFGISIRVTSDLIEDANFGIVEFHLQQAAKGMGDYASGLALTVLQTATDGWGTVNSANTGDADETKFTNGTTSDIITAYRALCDDRWIPDTIVTTPEAWGHSIAVQALPIGWGAFPPTAGYLNKIGHLDVLQSTRAELHASTDAEAGAFSNCITIVFDRSHALLTGRKRWLQINNYVDPVKDLAGAVVSARQDSVTLYNDSIYVLTET